MAFEELLKIEKDKNLEVEDLVKIRASLLADVDYLYDRYADGKVTWKEYQELVQKLHQNTIDNLLAQEDKLARVFQSKFGSYYFVLASGQSWRIKSDQDKLISQPVMDHIFFIDRKTATEFLDKIAVAGAVSILDSEIPLVEYQKGVGLLEIGAHNLPRPVIINQGGQVRISGCINKDSGELEKNLTCGAHVGHQITKIIK